MGAKTTRIIKELELINGSTVILKGEWDGRIIEKIWFMRDGLSGINTVPGLRDQHCYILELVGPGDKDIEFGVVPHDKVQFMKFAEKPFEEDSTCEVPSVELTRVDD